MMMNLDLTLRHQILRCWVDLHVVHSIVRISSEPLKRLFTQPPLDAIKSLGLTIKSARSLFALLLSLLVSLAASANSDIRTQTESLIDIVNSIRGSGDGSIKSSSATECKVVDETDVVIYIGQGTTRTTQMWAEALIDFWRTGRRHQEDTAPLNETKTTWGR